MPIIHDDRCAARGFCVTVCPGQALQLVNNRPVITNPARCAYCGLCEEACPRQAIELRFQIIGP